MKRLFILGLTLFVCACTEHPVRCDRLQPINAPAAAQSGHIGPAHSVGPHR
jgi:hypothetical protein